jgi:hypothetical protein
MAGAYAAVDMESSASAQLEDLIDPITLQLFVRSSNRLVLLPLFG